jgi:hypothetical protein
LKGALHTVWLKPPTVGCSAPRPVEPHFAPFPLLYISWHASGLDADPEQQSRASP